MSQTSAFVKSSDHYKRDLRVMQHYRQDTAAYLHMQTGQPMEKCLAWITRQIAEGGRFAMRDPKVEFLQRNADGDREKRDTTLTRYLGHTLKSEEVLAPTFTTYISPKVKKSLLSVFQDTNVKLRSKAKKEMFAAQNAGQKLLAAIKKLEQGNKKISNNSISGAHLSPSTPLHNPTAHSSLTSTCRITAGFGNANNEKFLSGNRHYYSHHVVLNNMVVLSQNNDLQEMDRVIRKYGIHYPTPEDVLACIQYSTDLYWTFLGTEGNAYWTKIVRLAYNLTPIQRAAFVYTGDMHHLKKHNDVLVRNFFDRLIIKGDYAHYEDPMKVIKSTPESFVNYVVQVCSKETVGKGDKLHELPHESQCIVAHTCEILNATIEDYRDLIQAFWVTPNMPASVAYFPDSIRRSALTSDTDSTIFTVQDWVKWYKGKISFDDESMNVAAGAIFLTSETITHILAMFSANLGVSRDNLHRIAMKNEFKFDVFVPTQLGKHYFATISCQEGNVKAKRETEIKGVGLKSANAPRMITKSATLFMESIMKDVIEHGEIELKKYLDWVAREEMKIFTSLRKGELTYLRSGSIKDVASYTKEAPMDTPYKHHKLWNEVFGVKYGMQPEPPYATQKVSVNTSNKSKFKNWLAEMQDQELGQRFSGWMAQHGKTHMGTFHLPLDALQSQGIPSEIMTVIDERKIVSDICKIFYILMEVLGVYCYEKKVTRLISDYYMPQDLETVKAQSDIIVEQTDSSQLVFLDQFGEEHDPEEVFAELMEDDEEAD